MCNCSADIYFSFSNRHFRHKCFETRHHDAHVHGIGKLNVAFDGNNLIIELTSPAVNIVGFEHQAQNQKEEEQPGGRAEGEPDHA